MTQEEKELLLIDLGARLYYGVMCQVDDGAASLNDGKLVEIDVSEELVRFDADVNCYWDAYIDDVKPYLRPMSSMTDDERKEYNDIVRNIIDFYDCPKSENVCFFIILTDWLNKHHFDYRGLIDKGLAIEAPEGMYK